MLEKDSRKLLLECVDNLVIMLVQARKPVRQEFGDVLYHMRTPRTFWKLEQFEEMLRELRQELLRVWTQ